MWALVLVLNVACSIFWLVTSLWKAPWYCLPYWVLVNDTRRIIGYSTSQSKWVSDRYWFYYKFSEIEQQKVYFLLWYIELLWHYFIKYVFSPIYNQWFLGILCQKHLNQSKNYIKFDFQYRSTVTLEVLQLLLPKISGHQTAEKYQGSANHDELDLKSDVNWPDSGKISIPTTVSSQF